MPKKFVTIALLQKKAYKNKHIALCKTAEAIEKAVKKGAKIICLQELFRAIYFPQYLDVDKDDYAEAMTGESTMVFSKLAKKYKVVIIVPIFEKTKNGKYYNSAVTIDVDGNLLDVYRKIHIPHDPLFYEKKYFKPGESNYKVYKTKYAKFAVLICYDQWFPEAARVVALKGAQIIFYPTAIGNVIGYKSEDGDWHDAWETVMRGHAIANSTYVAAVNRVGKEGKLDFWGQSFVCDPFGKILRRASSKKQDTLICKIDLGKNLRLRRGWCFFENRRPNTYDLICARKIR